VGDVYQSLVEGILRMASTRRVEKDESESKGGDTGKAKGIFAVHVVSF
jgi:hypothetical protein